MQAVIDSLLIPAVARDAATASYLAPVGLNLLSIPWAFFIFFGAGRLGTFFVFRELSRLERFALRMATGIAVIILWSITFHAIGYPLGLSKPVFFNDAGYPQVKPGFPLFAFGFIQVLLPALIGYALDIRDFLKTPPEKRGLEWFPGLAPKDGKSSWSDYLHYFGPPAIVLGTALFWFVLYNRWAMSYAWLADNDPWDHTWAVHWITKAGSFYEPLANRSDPIQIFHYLDAYPPGMDIFLSVPGLVSHGNLIWTLKFYAAVLSPLGLVFAYPFLVRLAEIGLGLVRFKEAEAGSPAMYLPENSKSPRFQMTPLKIRAHWIAAAGVIMLSCVPGWPSRFIWSHSLVRILWVAALMPLARANRSWKWVLPAVILTAATQVITTTAGFKLGLNLVLLFIALVTFLPSKRGVPIYRRPGAFVLPAAVLCIVFIWNSLSMLNKEFTRTAKYHPTAVSLEEAGNILEYSRLKKTAAAASTEKDRKTTAEALDGFILNHGGKKPLAVNRYQIEDIETSIGTGEPVYYQHVNRYYGQKLVRYNRLKRAEDGKPDAETHGEALGNLEKLSPESLQRFVSAGVNDFLIRKKQSEVRELQQLKALMADKERRGLLLDLFRLKRMETLKKEIEELEKKSGEPNVGGETENTDGEHLEKVRAELSTLTGGDVEKESARLRRLRAGLKKNDILRFDRVLNLSAALPTLDGLTRKNLPERLKTVDAAIKAARPDAKAEIERLSAKLHAAFSNPADAFGDDELTELLGVEFSSMLTEYVKVMKVNRYKPRVLSDEDLAFLKKDLADNKASVSRYKHRAGGGVAVLAALIAAAMGLHLLLDGYSRSRAAVRILAACAGGLLLSFVWWGPALGRYYGKPPGRVRIRDPKKTVRKRAEGKLSKIVETLAHPADIQLDRYDEAPLWKCVGTQDRNYSFWEFVHPPDKVGIQLKKIHNSVTSGIGLGISVVMGILVFLFGVLPAAVGLGVKTGAVELLPENRASPPGDPSDKDEPENSSKKTEGKEERKKNKKSKKPLPENVDPDPFEEAVLTRPALPDSVDPVNDSYLSTRQLLPGFIFGIALMMLHAIIGVNGNRPSIPFQWLAFRYWHMVSIVGIFCTVASLGWLAARLPRLGKHALIVTGVGIVTAIIIIGVTTPTALKVTVASIDKRIKNEKKAVATEQTQIEQLSYGNVSKAVLGRLTEELALHKGNVAIQSDKRIKSVRSAWRKIWLWPFLFAGFAFIAATLWRITGDAGRQQGNGGKLFDSRFAAVFSVFFTFIFSAGYMMLQGGSIRLALNNYKWLTTGVMDKGMGPESRMMERFIKNKNDMKMKSGDRVFPLGGPYRMRFLVAAGLDVSYFDYETYDWIHRNLLQPVYDTLGRDTMLKKIEILYDAKPVNIQGRTVMVANWPVMPGRWKKDSAGKKFIDGRWVYSYQSDPRRVNFDMPARRVEWKNLGSLRRAGNMLTWKTVPRPDSRNFPKIFHEWLVTNKYEYVWFDHVFYTFCPTRKYYQLEAVAKKRGNGWAASIPRNGRQPSGNINLFEMVLNDCLQSGYFEIAPGQEFISDNSRYKFITRFKEKRFPNRPCYLLKVREKKGPPAVDTWLPAPDTIKNAWY